MSITEILQKYKSLVIATHNPGKLAEITELFSGFDIEIISAVDFKVAEPIEDGKSFEENAIIKAKHSAESTKLPALADDSGLCVVALKNDPGVYSARWAGEDKNFYKAMQTIIDRLELCRAISSKEREAFFVCTFCLAFPDGKHITFTGETYGEIVKEPKGNHGFGYDPIFQPQGYNLTFAEMTSTEKQKISHRARAFTKLKNSLNQEI